MVEGAGTGTRVLEEMILAHELTHALEDQHYGLSTEPATDDRTLARQALYEGSATALMYAYVGEHFSAEETLGGLLSSAFEDSGDLPPFIQAQLLFAYVGGEQFVSDLLRRGAGAWSTPRSRSARRRRPSRFCIRTPTSTPTSRSRCGSRASSAATGRARTPACGASCRRASCWAARRARRPAGAATATSCGAAATTRR